MKKTVCVSMCLSMCAHVHPGREERRQERAKKSSEGERTEEGDQKIQRGRKRDGDPERQTVSGV